MGTFSPMMQQYFEIKNKHRDHILFFRLGDFYEMFFDDAILCSKELELTLTGRDCGATERAPMCGVPSLAYEGYVAKLVSKGYKVAICEQVEIAAGNFKNLVKREVVRVITPGTIIESNLLKEDENNYICCLNYRSLTREVGICFADTSTGEIFLADINEEMNENIEYKIVNELGKFLPREILVNDDLKSLNFVMSFLKEKLMCVVSCLKDAEFSEGLSKETVLKHFKKNTLEELGIKKMTVGIIVLGTLLNYLYENQKNGLERLCDIDFYNSDQYLNFGVSSQRSLDILENSQTKTKQGSLLGVIDKTKTAMGKRLIRKYLARPLINVALINKRLSAVEEFTQNNVLLMDTMNNFNGMFDIERILTKIVFGNANPRDLRSFEFTLRKLPFIKASFKNSNSVLFKEIYNKFDTLEDISAVVDETIQSNPPVNLKENGIIKDGFNDEIDNLRDILKNSKLYISKIEQEEKKKTNIKTLKISYNRVFGYYIEVSHLNVGLVPAHYIRKQTLANCERYVTQSLKELEEKILTANEKLNVLENSVYNKLIKNICEHTTRIQKTASNIAILDVICSFAAVSTSNRYVKPIVDYSDEMTIKDGRHPVVECMLQNEGFVANDCTLDGSKNQVAIITGPNMAGKSTYMRQNALIVLLAQIGCFVPAVYAKIGIIDGIFTRIGASDNLIAGQSTFMVEMSEVANILNNVTKKSLIILDEIGRGTSTYDGMSIARAILEYILDSKLCGAKTLFSTHYHELTDIENDFDNIKNYNIAVKKSENDIIFLKRIIKGAANKSYGIEVSKLSKLPEQIVNRATEILQKLESGSCKKSIVFNVSTEEDVDINNMTNGKTTLNESICEYVNSLDVNILTPIEALNVLVKIKKLMVN